MAHDAEDRSPAPPEGPVVHRLVGVYHARGTLLGELSYWVGARLGRAHCALCDITHGTVREKAEWRTCRAGLPVPFEAVHLDERDPAVARATEGSTPCVVAVTDEGVRMLLDTHALERCGGSPERLAEAVDEAIAEAGLVLPG